MNNTYAEQAVCGSILIDPRCLEDLRGVLTGEDFATAWGRSLFRAACALADRGEAVDPVSINLVTSRMGLEVTQQTLLDLMQTTPTAANCLEYARQMREHRVAKEAAETAQDLCEAMDAGTQAPGEAITRTMDRLRSLEQRTGPRTVSAEDASVSFLGYLQDLEDGKVPGPLSTGFPRLDWILGGGMVSQGLYILGARPGVGKTTLGLKIAAHVARSGPVLFVSLEMPVEQLMARLVADASSLDLASLTQGLGGSEEKWEKVHDAVLDLAKSGLIFKVAQGTTVEELGSLARSVPGLRLLVIDYLNLLKGEGRTRYDQVTAISNSLKGLALSLGIPVLCLAQLNRSCTQRPGKEPALADLRDSGAIEQDADAVILLHQPNQEEQVKRTAAPQDPVLLEARVVKNRHGRLGRSQMDFYGINGRVREL